MHIVIAGASTTNCRVIRNNLARMGYSNVADFVRAPAAISHLKQYRTDFLVTGKRLRGTSGFQLVEKVRAIPGYEMLPILMVASHYVPTELLEGTDKGVNGFLLLPFSPAAFQRKVTDLIDNRTIRRTRHVE